MENLGEYSLFARRIGLVGVVQTLAGLKGLITLPILTRVLGASDYGLWALILVTVALAGPLVRLGLDNAVARFLPSRSRQEIVQGVVTAFSVILVTGIVAGVVFFFASNPFATVFLRGSSIASAMKVASLLLVLESLAVVALGSFRVFGQIKRYAAVLTTQTLLEVGLMALLVLSGHGLTGAVVALVISRAVTLVVSLALIFSYAGFARPDFSLLPAYFRYGLPLVTTTLFAYVIASSDRYVIGGFLDAAQVGIYSAAYSIGHIVFTFSSYIQYVLRPTAFREHDAGRVHEVKTYLSYSWKYLLMLAIPSAFGLSVLGRPLLASLTTPEFILTGGVVVPLVAFGMIMHGAMEVFGLVVLLPRRSGLFATIVGSAAALNLGLNILLVPRWGAIAAAVTTLTSYTVAAGLMCYHSRRYVRFALSPGFIGKSVVASAVMATAVWAFSPAGIGQIVLAVIIGAAVYFAVLYFLKGFNRGELRFFVRLTKETIRGVVARR